MEYKLHSFIAYIDGSEGKFFSFHASCVEGAKADLMEAFGTDDVVISCWR